MLSERDFAAARKEAKKKTVTLKGQDPNKIIGCITNYDVSAVHVLRNSMENCQRSVKEEVALLTMLNDEHQFIYHRKSS